MTAYESHLVKYLARVVFTSILVDIVSCGELKWIELPVNRLDNLADIWRPPQTGRCEMLIRSATLCSAAIFHSMTPHSNLRATQNNNFSDLDKSVFDIAL